MASPQTSRSLDHGLDSGSVTDPRNVPSPRPVDGEPGKYVYCIIQSDQPKSFGHSGIGGRGDDVRTIVHGNLAAVASNTPVVVYDPTRENVMTHERINEAVMKEFTVIPMSFGTVFRTEDDVVEFLRHTKDALVDVLSKMKDKIEFGLKLSWEPDLVMKSIEEEREDIRLLKERIVADRHSSTYFARMQIGRMVAQALEERADAHVREVYETLRDSAVASRHNKPIGEKMIMNAAFLVDRANATQFEGQVLALADKHAGQLRVTFTGPWPPYNFVNIRLKLEHARATS